MIVGFFLLTLLLSLTPLCIGLIGALLKRRAESARRAHYEAEHQHWKQAIAVWDQLYYCTRDDVVFLPGRPEMHTQACQMRHLLQVFHS